MRGLRRCPFCGGEPKQIVDNAMRQVSIICSGCRASITRGFTHTLRYGKAEHFMDTLKVISEVDGLWNRRGGAI